MRFGAFIITFNRPQRLHEVLTATFAQTHPPEFILVVDNGDASQSGPILAQFPQEKVYHHVVGDNIGPAGAAALALQRLVSDGYDWIAWGDEDTPPQTPDTFERLLQLGCQSDANVGGVGAVGSYFDWKTGELQRLPNEALHGIVDVDGIGSGLQLITKREIVERVGLPNARLFFGFYDPEYCLRIRRAGYRLVVDGDLMRIYREKAGRINLQVKRAFIPDNSYNNLWRRYYVTRNYIYMMRNTFQRPDLARRETLKAVARSAMAWQRGANFGAAFSKLQLRGVVDGYQANLGRTVLPQAKIYGHS